MRADAKSRKGSNDILPSARVNNCDWGEGLERAAYLASEAHKSGTLPLLNLSCGLS